MSTRYDARPRGLRHELILTPGSQELLDRLEQDCETPQTKQFFQHTLNNWKLHNLMNCIQIDADSCPKLFDIFLNAKTLLAKVCEAELTDKALTRDFEQTELWLKRDTTASASSMALPGTPASVVLSHEMVNLVMQGKWDDEDHKAQLTGVILHELTHILYKHCQYITSMNRLLALTQDGSEMGEFEVQQLTAVWRIVQTGFELTADRGLYTALKKDLTEIPKPIKDLFTKLAGGNIGVPLNSQALFSQIRKVRRDDEALIETIVMMADAHPPLAARLIELELHRRRLVVQEDISQAIVVQSYSSF